MPQIAAGSPSFQRTICQLAPLVKEPLNILYELHSSLIDLLRQSVQIAEIGILYQDMLQNRISPFPGVRSDIYPTR